MTIPTQASDLARCDAEIAAAEALLRAGHADVEGLLQCIQDWSAERRLIEEGRFHSDTGVRGYKMTTEKQIGVLVDEIETLKQRVYGLKRRIHLREGHNQYFERCESAWCNPSPDNDPAMEIRPYQTDDD